MSSSASGLVPPRSCHAYLLALLALLIALSACGRHDELDESDDKPKAGSSGGGGRGGRGGSVFAGTGAGAAGTMAASLGCGTKRCVAPPNLLAAFGFAPGVACCVDAASSQCGSAVMAGATCEAPAVADARCPALNLAALAALGGGAVPTSLNGCCTPDEMCGLDGALFGRGCVENAEIASTLSTIPFVGALFRIPAARTCDAAGMDTEDAGMTME